MINYRYKVETALKKTFWGVMTADNIISCIHQLSNGEIIGVKDGRIIDISVTEERLVISEPAEKVLNEVVNKAIEPRKTFLDLYLKEGNEVGHNGIPSVCPNMMGYEKDFNCGRITCNECWNREIPM